MQGESSDYREPSTGNVGEYVKLSMLMNLTHLNLDRLFGEPIVKKKTSKTRGCNSHSQPGAQNYRQAMNVIAYIRKNCNHDWRIAGSGVFDADKRQWKRYWVCNKCQSGKFRIGKPQPNEQGDNTPIIPAS